MKQVQLALVVPWHVHTRMFLKAIRETFGDAVTFPWVYDHKPERGRPFAELLGAKFTDNYDDVLADPAVDAIMCESETCLHRDLLMRAARAGKHVYTDKCLATTTADGLAIKEAVEAAGVKFCVSHESLPTAAYVLAKRFADEGKLGDIVSVYFRRAHGMAKAKNPAFGLPADWFDKTVAGGGALIDLGVHGLSMLPYIAGTPKSVACVTHSFTGSATEDSATILVDFESGAQGTAHTDMVTNTLENLFEIVGTEGQLCVVSWRGNEQVYLTSTRVPGCEDKLTLLPPDTLGSDQPVPVCQFLRLLLEDAPETSIPGFDFDMGLTVTRLAEAAYEAAETGRAVAFDKRW